jgi:hypothetical protein
MTQEVEASPGEEAQEAIELRGERRWLPALVILTLVGLGEFTPLPNVGPLVSILPFLAIPLLIVIVAVDPGRIDRRSSPLRILSVSLTLLLALIALTATGRLVVQLVHGAPDLRSATTLLLAGAEVWSATVLVFGLLFWELDGGGAAERLYEPLASPDIAFPQQLNPDLAPSGWRPTYPDYLYLGLTNALAFSPTDAMPLKHWAKLLMGLQSIISVVILSLVVANAVNILS